MITPTETILTSTASPPPKRVNADVKELCTIRWDTKVDVSSLPIFINSIGTIYHKLQFEVEMACNSGGSLDFAVYHDGKRQCSKHVIVDYETRS